MATKAESNKNTNKKTETENWAEGKTETAAPSVERVPVSVAAPVEPAPAAKKTRKKGQRTPIATRLAAAPTPARKAIIIEGQLQMIQKRKAGILALVDQSVLDQVDPELLK